MTAGLRERHESGEPIPVEDVVGSMMPKMRLHPHSLHVTHTLDICQDDVAALLHLLMKVGLELGECVFVGYSPFYYCSA